MFMTLCHAEVGKALGMELQWGHVNFLLLNWQSAFLYPGMRLNHDGRLGRLRKHVMI
jgi:hypothetical protein